MTIDIPNSLFDKYNEACDTFLENPFFSKQVTLIYPSKKEECSNCNTSMIGDSSTNTYRHGGPMPFGFGSCPLCGGNGLRETEITDTIRLRLYFNRKDWIKVVSGINIPDAAAMIIGYMTDLPKLRKCSEIVVSIDNNQAEFRLNLIGVPIPHGFGQRYFLAFLNHV